jgi:geranylgeranyl reductase family protein
MYDVAVVGAGPAGATAALAAAQAGASVLLLDRYDFPRDKPCGDGIAPQALDVLSGLGVDAAHGYPPIALLRLDAPGGASASRVMPRPARVIPREVFDARIVGAALAAGARFERRTIRSLQPLPDRVLVDGTEAGVVIGADGASSVVRRLLGIVVNPPRHLAIAIRGYAPYPADEPLRQHIVMAETGWPAYAWQFPIGDGRCNVGYGEILTGTPLSRSHLLGRMESLLPWVGEAERLRAHHLPLSTHRPVPGRGRILLAGDALSLINPFTGEGIFYAVVSGAIAGRVAASGSADPAGEYAQALRARLGRHLRHTALTAFMGRSRHLMRSGIAVAARDQRVFNAFVELGLGDGLITPRLLGSVFAEGIRSGVARRRRAGSGSR